MPAYGYDDDGEREHDCCDVCGSGSCPGSGSGGDDACTYPRRRPAPPLSPREREIVDRFEAASDPYTLDHEPFVAGRGMYGWEYAGDAVRHVEEHNCSKGCLVPDPKSIAEFGPGGQCSVLALLFTGDPIVQLEDTGTHVLCHVREPI